MEDTQLSGSDRSCRLCSVDAAPCCLTADQTHPLILDKIIKGSDRIGSAADTGQHRIRKPSLLLQDLFLDLLGDYRLKISDDRWERMWTHRRPQYIMGICDPVCPLSHGLGNRIF